MVTDTTLYECLFVYLLAAESAGPVLERLDPPRRAAVVMALLGLVLIGLLLVTIAMLGAHWVRRLARHNPGRRPTSIKSSDTAGNRRLRDSLQDILPACKAGETLHVDASTNETKVDS